MKMPILIGQYSYSVDEKGRLNMPSKFRKNLAPEAEKTFVITKGVGKCLDVYPMDVFNDKFVEKFNSFSQTNPKHRFYTSQKGSDSDDSTLDSQGRITIPKQLLEYAGIKREILIIGAFQRIELWDPKERDIYLEKMKKADTDMEEGMLP